MLKDFLQTLIIQFKLIDQNIFAVNADNSPCGDIFSYSDISDNESRHIFSNEEIQNLLTDYYKEEVQFKGNCQMGTGNFIQSEVSSSDGAKLKPETNVQVMDTIMLIIVSLASFKQMIFVFH